MKTDRPNVAHLRHAIDTGRTGDKVAYPDPAAAPLGTDDEAAGTPPTSAEVEQAMHLETRRGSEPGTAETRGEPRAGSPGLGPTPHPKQEAHGGQTDHRSPVHRYFVVAGALAGVLLIVLLVVF